MVRVIVAGTVGNYRTAGHWAEGWENYLSSAGIGAEFHLEAGTGTLPSLGDNSVAGGDKRNLGAT